MTGGDRPRRAVYVASPLGFNEAGRRYRDEVLHPRLVAEGFIVLDPWQDPAGRFVELLGSPRSTERDRALRLLNHETGQHNAELIEASDLLLAVLDGAEIDSGTAAEIGYAAALGRPVVGLRSDFRQSGDNDQARVNLQVEYFIAASGGAFATSLGEAVIALRARQ